MQASRICRSAVNRFSLNGFVLSLVAWSACSVVRGDWPTYLNGNQRLGFTSAKLDPALKLAWSYKAPTKPIIAWEGPRNTPIEGHVMLHRVNFDDALQAVRKETSFLEEVAFAEVFLIEAEQFAKVDGFAQVDAAGTVVA